MGRKANGHPGQVLEEKFLKPMDLSNRELADAIRVPVSRIDDVVNGKAAVTADLAVRLGKYFGNGPEFWLELQMALDLRTAGEEIRAELEAIRRHADAPEPSPRLNPRPGDGSVRGGTEEDPGCLAGKAFKYTLEPLHSGGARHFGLGRPRSSR